MKLFKILLLIGYLKHKIVGSQFVTNNDMFNVFNPIYNYNISVNDENGIFLRNFSVTNIYDCFLRCNTMSNCFMIYFNAMICKLYSKVKYSTFLTAAKQPFLFEKNIPDYSSLNSYLTNYWPFNNNLYDIISGKDLFGGGPETGKRFVKDRLNRPNGALYLNQSYYLLPEGIYFSGEYTLSLWVRLISVTSYSRILSISSSTLSFHCIVFSLSLGTTGKPYIYTSVNNFGYNSNSTGIPSLKIGKWQNIVFTLDKNSKSITYIDGVIVNQQSNYLMPTNFIRTKNYFGAHYGGTAPNAEFDDIKIFNRSLNQEEVKTLLNMYY